MHTIKPKSCLVLIGPTRLLKIDPNPLQRSALALGYSMVPLSLSAFSTIFGQFPVGQHHQLPAPNASSTMGSHHNYHRRPHDAPKYPCPVSHVLCDGVVSGDFYSQQWPSTTTRDLPLRPAATTKGHATPNQLHGHSKRGINTLS